MVVDDWVQQLWTFWYSTLVEHQKILVKILKIQCAKKSTV